MEEWKDHGQEETYEQRPSQKYGRTAYQEQLKRERLEGEQRADTEEKESYWQQKNVGDEWQNWKNSYTDPRQTDWEGQQAFERNTSYEVAKNDNFAVMLMILVAVSALIGIVASAVTLDAFEQIQTIDYYLLFEVLSGSKVYMMLSYLSNAVSFAVIVFLVLDIRRIYKANYKILGLILFAIFLRPAYFIWRAHILGKKKTIPIVYTVLFYGVQVLQVLWIFQGAIRLVERVMI